MSLEVKFSGGGYAAAYFLDLEPVWRPTLVGRVQFFYACFCGRNYI